MKSIGLFTSGGDSPGMNACIRAVVRAGTYYNLEVYGIRRGYDGMIDGDIIKLDSGSVSNIIQRGGTLLKSARSERFMTFEGRKQAYANLKNAGIDGVVAIGGDGTFKGASVFNQEFDFPFIGIPGTIDNDLVGTDYTLGYDTAVNTALEAIDKIRDTADSHNRLFFIEVMGRDTGFIALQSGIAGGAEAILIPETKTTVDQLINIIEKGWKREKSSMIVVVAEGDEEGGAFEIARKVKSKFNHYDTRVSILGHIQRGGNPTCMDRVLAGRLGLAAVEALLGNKRDAMVGVVNNQIAFTPFVQAVKKHQKMDSNMLKLMTILSS